jgi:hypothetical protein
MSRKGQKPEKKERGFIKQSFNDLEYVSFLSKE